MQHNYQPQPYFEDSYFKGLCDRIQVLEDINWKAGFPGSLYQLLEQAQDQNIQDHSFKPN